MTSKSMRSLNVAGMSKAASQQVAPEMETLATGGGFGFSVMKGDLDSTEYTLTTIVLDVSGSTSPFADALLTTLKSGINGCKMSGRVDYILARVVLVNDGVEELHGFMPVGSIDTDGYKALHPRGATALYDGIGSSMDATFIYGKRLTDTDYTVNGCVYVVTDGLDNRSRRHSKKDLAKMLKDAVGSEQMGSILTVLVGINSNETDPDSGKRIGDVLAELAKEVGFDQFIDVGDATPKTMAKIGGHISKSVSSQSQRVVSKVASQPVPF